MTQLASNQWYTKYRPRRFDQTIQGPDRAPVRNLVDQIKAGDIEHVNLLLGVYGTGKTACALTMLMRRNCSNYADHLYEPCGRCDGCVRAETGGQTIDDVVGTLDITGPPSEWKTTINQHISYWGQWARRQGRGLPYLVFIDEYQMLSHDDQMWIKFYMDHTEYQDVAWLLAASDDKNLHPAIRSRAAVHRFVPPKRELMIPWLEGILCQESMTWEPGAPARIIDQAQRYPRDVLKEAQQICRGRSHIKIVDVDEHFGAA